MESAGFTPAVAPNGEGTHISIPCLSTRTKIFHFGENEDHPYAWCRVVDNRHLLSSSAPGVHYVWHRYWDIPN